MAEKWRLLLHIGRGMSFLAKNSLLGVDFVGVVMVVFASEKKRKLGIVFLLGLGHVLKLRAIPCHKFGQLINDVA